jgi:hypothetical protein
MKELVDLLTYKDESLFLNHLISAAMQHGQYSPGARNAANIMLKYEKEYGHLTVGQIRKLYSYSLRAYLSS